MSEDMIAISKELKELKDYLIDLQTLVRVNNLLISKFILQLSEVRKELNLDRRVAFFKFEISSDDYELLVKEYGKSETDRALYRLDRLLLTNKQQCPNNIRKYIENKLRKSNKEYNKNEGRKEEQL